jgi:hypothetical protein
MKITNIVLVWVLALPDWHGIAGFSRTGVVTRLEANLPMWEIYHT